MFVLPPTETQTMEGVSMRCEISRMSVFVRQHVQNTSLNFYLFINCYGLFSFNSWQFLQHSNLSMHSNNSQLNTHYSLQYTAPGKNLYRCTVISQSKQMANVTCRVKVSLLVVTGILRTVRQGGGGGWTVRLDRQWVGADSETRYTTSIYCLLGCTTLVANQA